MTTTIYKSLNSQDTISFNHSKIGESKSSILDHADSKLRSGGLEDSPCMLDSGLCINPSAVEPSRKLQPTVCNTRPLSQDAETYQLDKFSKNLMLVFNMYNIPGREPRYGTDNDVEALKRCFEPLGFDVMVYTDFTKDEIYTTFEKLISDDLSDVGCLAVVFLSHGNGDGIILTRDHPINESAIIEFLSESNAPSFITKPKILIFQVSRYGGTTETKSYNFQEVDFLSLHSTCPGMLSYSQNCDDMRSLNKSGSGESRSTNINHEASTSRNDDLEDSPNNNALDSKGVVNATTSQTLQITSRNRRYLSKWETTYQLDKFYKNLMLVFIMLDEESKYGRGKDLDTLKLCFKQKGFVIKVYENKSKEEICTIFDNLILEDLSDFGCLAVVFLTHSEGNGILLTMDGDISVGDIIGYLTGLKAPNIITKPKILIFQTSQSCTAIDGSSKNSDGDHRSDIPYAMANETDFLMLHSTYSWMESHKGKNEGSPFIQFLCEFITDSDPDDDIFSIITQVTERVSISYGDRIKKHVPIMTSTLSRKLCFNTPLTLSLWSHIIAIAKKVMSFSCIFLQRLASSTRPPEAVSIEEYSTKDFKLKYFEYVRDLLNYFVETRCPNCPSADQAQCLLDIANTINCSPSLSLLREQTCIEMVIFLEDQYFNGKEHMFCHKY